MANNEEKKGILIVHQFPRAKNAPSPSPYPMKLETFLRMNKIPFEPGQFVFMLLLSKYVWLQESHSYSA